jgi:CHAT domain-containing protein
MRIYWFHFFLILHFCCSAQTHSIQPPYDVDIEKGKQQQHQTNYDSAIYYINKSHTFNTKDPDINYLNASIILIDSYIFKGEFNRADSLLKVAYQIHSKLRSEAGTTSLFLDYFNALIQYQTGQYQLAKKNLLICLDTIDKSTPNDSLKVLVLKNIGNCEFLLCDYSAAQRYYRIAGNLEKKRTDHQTETLSNLLLNIALTYEYMNQYDSSTHYYALSLEIKKSIGSDEGSIANLYSNYCSNLISLGKLDEALKYASLAEKMYLSKYGEGYYKLAYVYFYKANIFSVLNDYHKSMIYYGKAENEFRKYLPEDNSVFRSISSNIASMYILTADYRKAIGMLHAVLNTVYSDGESVESKVISLRKIGECYLRLNKMDSAYYFLNKSLKLAMKEFGNKHDQTYTCHKDISLYYTKAGNIAMAEKSLDIAETGCREFYGDKSSDYTNVLIVYCNHYLKIGEYQKALQKAQQAIVANSIDFNDTSILSNPDFTQLQIRYLTVGALTLKAKAYEKLFFANPWEKIYAEKALEAALLGIKLFESFKSLLVEEKSQLYLTEKINMLFQSAINASWYVHELSGKKDFPLQAFLLSEKNKSAILASGMKLSGDRLSIDIPDSLLRAEKDLSDDLRSIHSMIVAENAASNPDIKEVVRMKEDLYSKLKALDSLKHFLEETYPAYRNYKPSSTINNIAELQQNIHKNEVLLQFSLTENNIIAFAISSDSATATKTSISDAFKENLQAYLDILNNTPSMNKKPMELIEEFQNLSHHLYLKTIKPIESFLANKDLIIIPDDLLGYLPFESLATQNCNSCRTFRDIPYLINEHAISYHYSTGFYLNTRDRECQTATKALVMAPVYLDFNEKNRPDISGKMNYLKFSAQESEMVHQLIGGKLFLDSMASEHRFKTYAEKYAILHLAMHTSINDDDPLSSGLVFSPANDTIEDGYLNVFEIYPMNLKTKLVVLSACETGGGKLHKGEGIMSIARGFIFAGTQALLYTHWYSNDFPSIPIVNNFYENLNLGKRKALQQSKLDYLSKADLLFSHPYYWSPFVIMGNDSPIDLRNSKNMYWYLLAAVLIILTFSIRKVIFRAFSKFRDSA